MFYQENGQASKISFRLETEIFSHRANVIVIHDDMAKSKDKNAAKIYEYELTKVFFDVMNQLEKFSADDVQREARKRQIPPQALANLGNLFRSFKRARYIAKSKDFKISTRDGNSSSPLAVWVRVKR